MQITEKRIELDSSWFSAEREITRTEGLHLSHVIDYIEECEGKVLNRGEDKTNLHRYSVAGFLWERALDKLIHLNKWDLWDYVFTQALFEIDNPKVFRPGEQKVDCGECPVCGGNGELTHSFSISTSKHGMARTDCPACRGTGILYVYATPDGISIPENAEEPLCLEEWKYTSKSSKTGIEHPKFGRWLQFQIPFYLKILGLNTCRLRVYFSRGDYTSGLPEWREFTITYSDLELTEISDMIINNARSLVKQLYLKEITNG